jgi:hypothetical protein
MINMNTAPINDTTPPTASTAAYLSKTNKMTDPPSAAMICGTQSAKFSVAKNSPSTKSVNYTIGWRKLPLSAVP